MKLTEYDRAILSFLAENKYGKRREDKIYSEFLSGQLTRRQISTILKGLKKVGYIAPIVISEQEIQFIAEMSENPVTNAGYKITQLGKGAISSPLNNITNNTFANINNSAIANNSPHSSQSVSISKLPDDIQQKYHELQEAIAKKDKSALAKAFAYIADKSVDVAIAIISGNLLP